MSGLANKCIIIKTIMIKTNFTKFLSFVELNCFCNNLFCVYCFNSQMHHTDNIYFLYMHLHYCFPVQRFLHAAFLPRHSTTHFEIK